MNSTINENDGQVGRFLHIEEAALLRYDSGTLTGPEREQIEKHLKICLICQRRLPLLRKEQEAITAGLPSDVEKARAKKLYKIMSLKEDLWSEASTLNPSLLKVAAKTSSLDTSSDTSSEIIWKKEIKGLVCLATLSKNGDLTFWFSSEDLDLEDVRLHLQVGTLERKIITLKRKTKKEVEGSLIITRQERPSELKDTNITLGIEVI